MSSALCTLELVDAASSAHGLRGGVADAGARGGGGGRLCEPTVGERREAIEHREQALHGAGEGG